MKQESSFLCPLLLKEGGGGTEGFAVLILELGNLMKRGITHPRLSMHVFNRSLRVQANIDCRNEEAAASDITTKH